MSSTGIDRTGTILTTSSQHAQGRWEINYFHQHEFNDIFHELNDELETEANEYNLNNFYIDFNDEILEERFHPSQYQSQAAVSVSENKINKDNCRFFHDLPDYLSASNASFQTAFFSELRRIFKPIDFQDLQQLTFLTHQMTIIHLHQELWHCFLQSGTNQLKRREQLSSQHHSFILWPKIVTTIMISQRLIDAHRQDTIEQDLYVNFIQKYLQQSEQKVNQCRLQFDLIKNRLSASYTDVITDKIDRFVRNEGLIAMRLHFEARIALLKYSCNDRACQMEYFQQKPTDLQLQIVNRICSLTFEKEKMEQEMLLFNVGMLYNKLPKSLDLLETTPPISITTISDPIIRIRLSSEYQRIIQRTKVDLMNVLRTANVVRRNDYQKNYDRETTEIWKDQRQLLIHERLTTTMLTLIEQRQKNIIECVKCIYELKGNFFLQAPTSKIIL